MKTIKYLDQEYDTIVILGPTASGKSELSLLIAHQINSIIINADAYQIYKKMDIGTGKINYHKLDIPHYLFDIIDYDQELSLIQYQKKARDIINKAHQENKIPIIVGGSNLYVDSIIYDYEFSENENYQEIYNKLDKLDLNTLQTMLKTKNININNSEFHNKKRIVNILTKNYLNIKLATNKKELVYRPLFIKISLPRDILYAIINKRVDEMFAQGLIDEVIQFKPNYRSQQAIGYKEIHQYLAGVIDLKQCQELIKQKTRNYAKRQLSWLNKQPAQIILKKEGKIWKKIN